MGKDFNVDTGFVHLVIVAFGGMGILSKSDMIDLVKSAGFDRITTRKIEPTGQWLYFIGTS